MIHDFNKILLILYEIFFLYIYTKRTSLMDNSPVGEE